MRTGRDRRRWSAVISSLDVLHIFVVPHSLAARFTDKTRSYGFTYARDWTRLSTGASHAAMVSCTTTLITHSSAKVFRVLVLVLPASR